MSSLRADLQLEEELLFGLRPKTHAKVSTRRVRAETRIRPGLAGLEECARREPKKRFSALLHYMDVELLKSSYGWLKEEGMRGGGGRTWNEFGANLHANAVRLYTRVHRGRHRTLPSWRRVVAVARGRHRNLKIAALKDRIVQRAATAVLEAIYQSEFVEFARGFRNFRDGGNALERITTLARQATFRWVIEADIHELRRSINQKRLLHFLQHRVGDARMLELIRKWLQAGALDEVKSAREHGARRHAIGAVLADVYYHYSLDSWIARWRHRHARSTTVVARDLGVLIVMFEHKPSARRFHGDLRAHLKQLMPSLQAQNLRFISYARFAAEYLKELGGAGAPAVAATIHPTVHEAHAS